MFWYDSNVIDVQTSVTLAKGFNWLVKTFHFVCFLFPFIIYLDVIVMYIRSARFTDYLLPNSRGSWTHQMSIVYHIGQLRSCECSIKRTTKNRNSQRLASKAFNWPDRVAVIFPIKTTTKWPFYFHGCEYLACLFANHANFQFFVSFINLALNHKYAYWHTIPKLSTQFYFQIY